MWVALEQQWLFSSLGCKRPQIPEQVKLSSVSQVLQGVFLRLWTRKPTKMLKCNLRRIMAFGFEFEPPVAKHVQILPHRVTVE